MRKTTFTPVYFRLAEGGPGVTHKVDHPTLRPPSWGAETRCGRRLPVGRDQGAEWGEGARPCKRCEGAK